MTALNHHDRDHNDVCRVSDNLSATTFLYLYFTCLSRHFRTPYSRLVPRERSLQGVVVTQVHPSVHLAQGDPCSFTECGCSTWIALGTTEEVCTKAQATEGTTRRVSGSISTFRSEYLRLTRESADSGPLGTTTWHNLRNNAPDVSVRARYCFDHP